MVSLDCSNEQERIKKIITSLQQSTKGMVQPAANTIVDDYGRDPFLVLVSCILSLRTKDTVSLPASRRLFAHAKTPEQLILLSPDFIQTLIYPVGFYRNKARQLIKLSQELISQYGSQVPSGESELLSLPGVGRKTMNLVRGVGFGIPSLCVDTHVHRISNRLGLVKTKTPEETEFALKKIIPQEYWTEYGSLIVTWGQNICAPVAPLCSKCPLLPMCPQIGVTRKR
jgi:endonuclease-3